MSLLFVLETIVQIVTVLFFLTGIVPTVGIYQTKDTSHFPFVTFVLGLAGSFVLLELGVILNNSFLINPNFIGLILHGAYLLVYTALVKPKASTVRVLSLVAGACLALHVSVNHVISDVHSKEATLGISFTLINIAMIGLLVTEVIGNVIHKNAHGSPAEPMRALIVFSSTWLVYGLYVANMGMIIPHACNVAFASAKLKLISTYGGGKKTAPGKKVD